MVTIHKNERSWAIELISQINQFSSENDMLIKRAGGESTISEHRGQRMFPDVTLYGDNDLSSILQGWELKMPDVPIIDNDFISDAQRKAKALNLNSCVIWNFSDAKLYVYDDSTGDFVIKQEWNNQKIKTRNDVQLYKSIWEKTLQSVLISVNEYLISGDLKKSSFGKILTHTSVSRIVNENKPLVATTLREASMHNSIMEAHLSTWWEEIRTEYEGDEINKYYAYAKSIIISWTNRIIFAHLIKRMQQAAFAIDNLSYNNTPKDANGIFLEITQRSDFFNIFEAIPYNEIIPEKTWKTLIELSLFLKNSPISNINQKILQQILEDTVNVSKRLVNGQYPTPPIIAAILSRMTIHDVMGNCFDGCCGTGTIPSYIIDYKKEKIGVSKAIATTWASDKFKLPLQIANLAITNYDTVNLPCRLFQKDILSLKPGDKVEIVNPKTGDKEIFYLPLFDAFISNLPFIKSSQISQDNFQHINSIKNTYNLSGRSDFSYFITLHLCSLVKEGGTVGIILSNSFLGTEAGNTFLNAIRKNFNSIRIHISGNGKWFDNAQIVTTLVVMKKSTSTTNNSHISFFTWEKSLDEITLKHDYQNIIVNSSILDKEIDHRILTRVNYTDYELEKLRILNVSYNSLFTNIKWLLDFSEKIVPFNHYLTVFRGSRRGWDKMFFPDENDLNIEPQFLKDVLINARATNDYITKTSRKAFCCNMKIPDLEKFGFRKALSWIKKFENEKNEKGIPLPIVLARKGLEWYELPTTEIAELFTMMNPDNRMFYGKFNKPTFVNQRLIGIKRKRSTDDIDLLHALLNSIFSLFYIEAVGFGRGMGVLDINKDSISKCYILNPALLTKEQVSNIKNKFSVLIRRGIIDFDLDMEDPDRIIFDLTILKAYHLETYYEKIKNSIIRMRNIRKAVKATSTP